MDGSITALAIAVPALVVIAALVGVLFAVSLPPQRSLWLLVREFVTGMLAAAFIMLFAGGIAVLTEDGRFATSLAVNLMTMWIVSAK